MVVVNDLKVAHEMENARAVNSLAGVAQDYNGSYTPEQREKLLPVLDSLVACFNDPSIAHLLFRAIDASTPYGILRKTEMLRDNNPIALF